MSTAQSRARAGKYTKPKRGGGKHFSRDLVPVNADGEVENMWSVRQKPRNVADDDESSSEESSSEESDEEDSDEAPGPVLSREERKAAAKARKEAAKAKNSRVVPGELPPASSDEEDSDEDGLPANPNHTSKARSQAAAVPVVAESSDAAAKAPVKSATKDLSRREREALHAQQARERYAKLHAEGKTDEAKADLARLAVIREKREAEAARKKAEAEEKSEQEKSKAEQLDREAKLRAAAAGRGGKGGKKKK